MNFYKYSRDLLKVGGGRLAWSQWSGMVSSVKRFSRRNYFLNRNWIWKPISRLLRWVVLQQEARAWQAPIRAGERFRSESDGCFGYNYAYAGFHFKSFACDVVLGCDEYWMRLRWKASFVSDILRPVSDPAGSEVQFLTKNLALIRRKLDSSHCNTRMRIRITPHNSRWGEKGGKRREQISEISFWFWNTAQKYDAHRSRPSWRGWSLLLISPYFV